MVPGMFAPSVTCGGEGGFRGLFNHSMYVKAHANDTTTDFAHPFWAHFECNTCVQFKVPRVVIEL